MHLNYLALKIKNIPLLAQADLVQNISLSDIGFFKGFKLQSLGFWPVFQSLL